MKFYKWLIITLIFLSTHFATMYLYNISLDAKNMNFMVESFMRSYTSHSEFTSYMKYKGVDPKDIAEFEDDYNYQFIKELNFIGLMLAENNNRMDRNLLIMLRLIYRSNRVSGLVKDKIKECDISEYKGICHLEKYFEKIKDVDKNYLEQH